MNAGLSNRVNVDASNRAKRSLRKQMRLLSSKVLRYGMSSKDMRYATDVEK